jgi:hypothetical protein
VVCFQVLCFGIRLETEEHDRKTQDVTDQCKTNCGEDNRGLSVASQTFRLPHRRKSCDRENQRVFCTLNKADVLCVDNLN